MEIVTWNFSICNIYGKQISSLIVITRGFTSQVFTQVSNPLHPWCHSSHNQRKQRIHLTKAELLNSKHSETQEKTTWLTFYLTFTSVATVKVNQELILQARAEHQVSGGNWHSFCKFHSYYNVGLDNYGQN